ncbi:MAG TPA: TonB-dependent receptor [bacterium]|nr:TonB-dependent receptor [bacterium]
MIKKLFILFIAIFTTSLFAANYGKITGEIVDKDTGQPIVGVNITVQGTSQGAASDEDGKYIIIQVPPGTYTLEASMIGYTKMVITDVKVYSNRISYVNFQLSQSTVDMEEIVVEARKDVLEKDLTATARNMNTDMIESMPTTSVDQIISSQPGVINSGGMHFRGGRSGEVVYMIDGVPIRNPLFSDINSSEMINKGIISEMQVLSGTFSAEYGNAMSGVINITTREGGSRLQGLLDVKGSSLSPEENSKDYNRKVIRANLSGPLVGSKTRFFLSGRYNDRDSYLPWGYETEQNVFFKITDTHLNNIKLNLATNLSSGISKNYSHSWKYIPEMAWNEPESQTQMFKLSLTHTLSNKMYYSFSSYYTSYSYNSGDFDYRDLKPDYQLDGNQEFYTLNYISSYSDNQQNTIGAKGDFVWQPNKYNELKAGFIAKRHTIDRFYISAPYYDDHILDDYKVHPYEAGVYIQDKINFSTIILNAGLRFDLHAPNTDYWENPYNVQDSTASMKSSDMHTQISPRLGISYPITEKTVFHFGYGHYFQKPDYQYIYKSLITYSRDTSTISNGALYDVDKDGDIDYEDNMLINLKSGNGRFGDPNLKPERTITYEFGISQQLFEDYVLDVTLYSKQITNLLGARTHFAGERPEYWETFTMHINEDFAHNNGFEIQLRKRRGQHLTGEINYTYAVAEGSSSGPLERVGSELENKQTLKFFPLSFDQRHTLKSRLTYRYGNFATTLLGEWGSGLPYTVEMRAATDPYEINNARMPETWTLDLKVDYSINWNNIKLEPYLEIYNLTDRKNVVWVYSRTGKPDDSDSGKTQEYDANPENWGTPRLIYMGLNIAF